MTNSQLSEVFEQEIDPVMQRLGYCCGRKYTFNPQVLCCYGKQLCTIPRDAKYFSYQNRLVLLHTHILLYFYYIFVFIVPQNIHKISIIINFKVC